MLGEVRIKMSKLYCIEGCSWLNLRVHLEVGAYRLWRNEGALIQIIQDSVPNGKRPLERSRKR